MNVQRILLGLSLLLTLAFASCSGGLFATSAPAPILVEVSSSGDSCTIKDVSGSYPGSKQNNPWVHVHLFSPSAQVIFQSDDDAYQVAFPGGSPFSSLGDQFPLTRGHNRTSKVTFSAWKCGLSQPNQPSTNPNPPCSYAFQVTDTQTSKVCDPVIHVTK